MNFSSILYEVRDKVATITLNRPERRNAFTTSMAWELEQAWTSVKSDPEVTCVILTGAGDKAFCSGVDVDSVAEEGGFASDQVIPAQKPAYLSMTAIHNRCWKPVITAVNGMVCGGGLLFVADSDITVCAEHATFFDTHVRLGLISGIEPVVLARRIPLEATMRLALLGGVERMTAQQALAAGLVGEVVPQAELMSRARELATIIAGHSPTALAKSKQVIWESFNHGLDDAINQTWEVIRHHTQHPDHEEGPQAIIEKRKPKWLPYTSK